MERMEQINNLKQIDEYLGAHLDGYMQEIADLCAIPSVSARGEAGAAEMRACAALVASILERHGFAVKVHETPGNPVVVGRAEGRSPRTLLFYNHYDVQPVDPLHLWSHPPFEPVVRDGALYARGSKDDKGEFIARLAAVDALRAAHGGELPCGVLFVVEGQEEVGSPHIAAFVREHLDELRAEGALWEEGGTDAEGRPGMVLGRRGILSVELAVETLGRDAHSGAAHILPNAAWRLVRALVSLKDENEHIRVPGWYDAAKGPGAEDEVILDAMNDPEPGLREQFGVKEFVNGLSGRALEAAVFNPTANIGGITAGYQGPGMKTVIPARATAKLDFRLVPDQDPEDLFEKLKAHLTAEGFGDVSVGRVGAMWPYKASANDPLIALTRRTAEEVYGKPYEFRPMAGGSSPVYAFARPLGGIPVISAGVGYDRNRTHAPDEHVRVVDVLNAARHMGRILEGFGEL
jgi:acetylornithine deacetylase/succinyl-diaminopimelate desuccinylase-like protein